MGYKGFRLGRGLNTKAAYDAIADDEVVAAVFCSFDEVGTLSSARGRRKANRDGNDVGQALGGSGSLLGGFDGLAGATLATQKKYRFLKRGSSVYTNTTSSTALDDSTNFSSTYTTRVPTSSALTTPASTAGTLVNRVYGLTAPTFSATSILSGFTYGGYAYMCDGSATQRLGMATGAPPTAAPSTWGLVSPGYHELTTAASLDPTSGSKDITVTVTGGHALGTSAAVTAVYDGSAPYLQNIEMVGFEAVGGIPDNEINCLHSGYAGNLGDILVTSSGVDNLGAAGVVFTITFQNGAGAYPWPTMIVGSPLDGSALLVGGVIGPNTVVVTAGLESPPTNAVQTLGPFIGVPTAGGFILEVTRGYGDLEFTPTIPYNATVAQVRAALETLSYFASGASATTVCTVLSSTTFSFTTVTASTSSTPGGGVIGFIRQGPTLTQSSGGALVGGVYYYAYAFYNGVAKSNFSAQVPIRVTSENKVVLTNVLIGPVGTTERHIYRTDVDGRQLYYIGKIADNSTYTFTDTAKLAAGADPNAQPGEQATYVARASGSNDALARQNVAPMRGINEAEVSAKASDEKLRQELSTNLGLLSDWTDHDPPPTDLKHVGLIGDTAFGISGNTLRFSKAGEVEHWPLSNAVTPGRNLSETLLAWVAFDRDCILYTTNAIYRLSQVGLSFEDSRLEEIESPVGLAGEWAVAALDGQQGHVFLAKSGLYLFDGQRVTEISYNIEKLFTGDPSDGAYIAPGYMGQAFMVTSRDRMMMSYRHTESAGNNQALLLCDFQDMSKPNFMVIGTWEFTSLWREKSDNYVLGGDSNGYLYVLDYGWTDNGGTIRWQVYSKTYRFNGQTTIAYDEVILDADFGGATTTDVVVYTQSRGVDKTAEFVITSSNGRKRHKLKLPTHFRGEWISFYIESTHAGQRKIYEVGFTSQAFEVEP